MANDDEIERLLAWWLQPQPKTAEEVEARRRFWFEGSAEIDREVNDRFGALLERARAGELTHWTSTARGTLALIVVLDQFSRNLHRGKPEAFSHDGVALEIALEGFAAGRFDGFDLFERMFAALPLRHAENVELQKQCVALAVTDAIAAPPHALDFAVYSVDWARKHLDVIVRFGRFPHRNAAMARTSTPAEAEYLGYLKRVGQWL